MSYRTLGWLLLLALIVSGCGAPAAPRTADGAPDTGVSPAGPKRITTAVLNEPLGIGPLETGGVAPGKPEVDALANSTLTELDNRGVRLPELAQAVPTIENGLWKLLPDGRMETTWQLRPGATWHDGTPFTSADVLFTTRVEQDREIGLIENNLAAYAAIESVETPDPLSVVVRWKQPYLWADSTFGRFGSTGFLRPLPTHLLEKAFVEEKASFLTRPYWNEEFVGTGPFKVRQWVRGSHIVFAANQQYVLGRPKIDEIEVRFITDQNTMISNVLAGTLQMTMGRGISLEQGLLVRDQWKDGRIETGASNPLLMYPQLRPATPAVMGDARFRRAILQGVHRQELVDTLLAGLGTVADITILRPNDPEYGQVEGSIVKYAYDPRRTAQAIEELGFSKGADGAFQDSVGQKLVAQIFTTPDNETRFKSMFAIADSWQRLGISVQPNSFPQTQLRDLEWIANRPGLYYARLGHNLQIMDKNFHSSNIRQPETNWRGNTESTYSNPELDALLERFAVIIPGDQRLPILRSIVHHLTDQVVVLPMFYDLEISVISHRLKNVTGRNLNAGESWNAYQWEVSG